MFIIKLFLAMLAMILTYIYPRDTFVGTTSTVIAHSRHLRFDQNLSRYPGFSGSIIIVVCPA